MHEVDGVVRLSLAVSLAIKHFQHIVEGHSFYISLTTNICSVDLSPFADPIPRLYITVYV